MRSYCFALALAASAVTVDATEYRITAGADFEADCLLKVGPGDSCYLEKGDYLHDGLTRTHGTADARITIEGDPEACIKGSNTQDRVLQIAHDYYTVKDICFDGQHGNEYTATAIYVLGADRKSSLTHNGVTTDSSVTGLQLFDLEIKNFGSECIHFRYFVTWAEVTGCTIQHCGIEAFEQGGGGKVGEGLYVGTALDQVGDGKAPEVKLRDGGADNVKADNCGYNWMHHNTFRTYGNECIDVKEGSTHNLIEYNVCEMQRDPNSGGFDLRGDLNTVRFNEITECDGAGVRMGGHDGYGSGNHAYGNVITNMGNGAFNVMAPDQGTVCENKISGASAAEGEHKGDPQFDPSVSGGACSNYPGDLGGDSGNSGPSPSPRPDRTLEPTSEPTDETSNDDASSTEIAPQSNTEEGSGSSDGDDDSTDGSESTDSSESSDDDDDIGAGVNGDVEPSNEEVEVTDNAAEGTTGLGECTNVLGVKEMMIEHSEYADIEHASTNLFDANLDTYFSVHRETTKLTFELEGDHQVDGVALGFFMKSAEEERIQTFDIAVKAQADEEWTTVISRKESSGAYQDVQTFPFSVRTASYVRFESHGNSFNNWTPLTEVEICGSTISAETNALFGGLADAVDKDIHELNSKLVVCPTPRMLAPVKIRVQGGQGNVADLFDGNFQTRWSTENTIHPNDVNNDHVRMRMQGDSYITYVKIAFFDGRLARQHFGVYTRSATGKEWSPVLEGHIAEPNDKLQTFHVETDRVTELFIVGNGNDVGDFTKISEIEVWGC